MFMPKQANQLNISQHKPAIFGIRQLKRQLIPQKNEQYTVKIQLRLINSLVLHQ